MAGPHRLRSAVDEMPPALSRKSLWGALPLLGAAALGAAASAGSRQQVPEGAELTRALGCGACHAGVPEGDAIREAAPPFGEGMAPLAPAYIYHYLDDPRTVRPEIAPARMPRYDLEERERVALSLFVTNERELRGVDDAFRAAMARHPDADRAEGAVLFESLSCGSCHLHPEIPPRATAPDLGATGLRVREDWLADYLAGPVTIRPAGSSPGRGGRMPDFRLSPAEAAAITGFLLTLETPSPGDAPTAVDPSPGAPSARGGAPGTGGAPRPATGSGPAGIPPWEPLALSPFSMRKAETLLEDRWSCLGCHQLGEVGGRIGPRLDGIAERLRPAYVRHLIGDPGHLAPGTIMPASLEQADRIDLIASYLLLRDVPWTGSERLPGMPALPPSGTVAASGSVPPADPASATGAYPGGDLASATAAGPGAAPTPGAALYESQCAACHGITGEGDGFNTPFLPVAPTVHADSAAMSLRPDDTLYDGIHGGGRILGKSHRMPGFGASLNDAQKRALVAHIRTLCRCQGPAWSRDGRRSR